VGYKVNTLPPAQPYPISDQDEIQEKNSKDEGFRSWNAQEAAQLRRIQPVISPWRVVRWMLMVSVVLGLLALAAFDAATALSTAYGGLCVVIPAAILARGMTSPLSRMNAVSGAFAFMLWEMVKIGLSIGMLVLAPNLIAGLNWPALLVGLILTMKVYFVAAIVKPKPAAAGEAIEAPKNLN
jgi:ATP synthase protein I